MKRLYVRFKDTLRIHRTAYFVWSCSPLMLVAQLLTIVLLTAVPLASLYLIKLIIDMVSTGMTNHLPADDLMAQVVSFVLIAAVVALLGVVFQLYYTLLQTKHSKLVKDAVHDVIHRQAIRVDLESYENPVYYNAMHRALADAPSRTASLLSSLLGSVRSSLALIAMIGVLLTFHWSMAFVLFIAALPALLVQVGFIHARFQWDVSHTSTQRLARYYHRIMTTGAYAKELRLFAYGETLRQRFSALQQSLRDDELSLHRKQAIADAGVQLLSTSVIFSALCYLLYQTIYDQLSLGDLMMYFLAFQRGLSAIKGCLSSFASVYESNVFMANLDEFMQVKAKVSDTKNPLPIDEHWQGALRFEHVTFTYPNHQKKILDDISFVIRPGEHIALVGENGAGKSTIVKLLARMYAVSEGMISLNGHSIEHFSLADYRANIAMLFQDYNRYHFSVAGNISISNIEQHENQQAVQKAAKDAGADSFIATFLDQYDTPLGHLFEGAEELSGGQWQKIALARAFFRDAQLIILDEPSSSLDAKAEYALFQAFQRMAKERTAIIISHRLSTIRMADRILFLADGKIVESGSHEELMAADGAYAKLYCHAENRDSEGNGQLFTDEKPS